MWFSSSFKLILWKLQSCFTFFSNFKVYLTQPRFMGGRVNISARCLCPLLRKQGFFYPLNYKFNFYVEKDGVSFSNVKKKKIPVHYFTDLIVRLCNGTTSILRYPIYSLLTVKIIVSQRIEPFNSPLPTISYILKSIKTHFKSTKFMIHTLTSFQDTRTVTHLFSRHTVLTIESIKIFYIVMLVKISKVKSLSLIQYLYYSCLLTSFFHQVQFYTTVFKHTCTNTPGMDPPNFNIKTSNSCGQTESKFEVGRWLRTC